MSTATETRSDIEKALKETTAKVLGALCVHDISHLLWNLEAARNAIDSLDSVNDRINTSYEELQEENQDLSKSVRSLQSQLANLRRTSESAEACLEDAAMAKELLAEALNSEADWERLITSAREFNVRTARLESTLKELVNAASFAQTAVILPMATGREVGHHVSLHGVAESLKKALEAVEELQAVTR